MKKIVSYIAAIALAATACTKEGTKPVVLCQKEFKVDIVDTKVNIGEFKEGGKVSLDWTVGDKVKMIYPSKECDFEIIAIEGNVATISGMGVEGENAKKAWYPGEYFNAGSINIPTTQQYGRLPVILEGTVNGEAINFAATEASTIICYPITGTLTVKEAYLYLTDTPNLCGGLVQLDLTKYGADRSTIMLEPSYTLEFDEPVTLDEEEPFYVSFAVPAADKVASLELKVAAPEGALVDDYKLVRRKKTALSQTGGVVKMPVLNFADNDTDLEKVRWAFGTNHGGKKGIQERNNENVWTVQDNYVDCKMYTATVKDIDYQKLNAYLTNNLVSPNKIYPGNHRYMAIKSDIIYAMRNPADGSVCQSNPSWDLRLSDQESSGNKSFQFVIGKDRARYSGAIDCEEDNTVITYFDLMQNFYNSNKDYYYDSFGAIGNKGIYFVQQITYKKDGVVTHPDITAKIYFIGFFNSIDEIKAYNASLKPAN